MSIRIATLALACALVSTFALAQPKGDAAEAVKAAELARFRAMTSNDVPALEASLGDDLIYTHSSAAVDTKASYVGSIRSGALKYVSIEPSEMKVRVYGTTAVITAMAKMTTISKGETLNNQLRYTDIWVLRDGRWQMVGWQSTRIPQ